MGRGVGGDGRRRWRRRTAATDGVEDGRRRGGVASRGVGRRRWHRRHRRGFGDDDYDYDYDYFYYYYYYYYY